MTDQVKKTLEIVNFAVLKQGVAVIHNKQLCI